MSPILEEMKYLLSTCLPSFSNVCEKAEECPANHNLCHVTVVSLSQRDFGRIFRYCLTNSSDHALTADESDVPCDPGLRALALKGVPATEFEKLGSRYLLLGGVAEWNRTAYFQRELRSEKVRVALEVVWYIEDQDAPVSVPMIAFVRDNALHIPLAQPITREMLTGINPWYAHPYGVPTVPPPVPQVWSSSEGQWVPPYHSGVMRIPLPLTEVPLVRMGSERFLWPSPGMTADGLSLDPMSSMKCQMYDLPYIWPQRLEVPRKRYTGIWALPYLPTRQDCIQCRGTWAYGHGAEVEEDGSGNSVALGEEVEGNDTGNHLALALGLPALEGY